MKVSYQVVSQKLDWWSAGANVFLLIAASVVAYLFWSTWN